MLLQLQALRIIFFGTTNFAAYHLYMLVYCSIHKIIAIFTQETQILKQNKSLSINQISKACNLLLFQTNNLSISDIINIIKKLDVDIIIVVSYGLILPKEILNIPKLGSINVHGSLLPRWRGPAPIQRALEYGDTVTGISIIQMDSGIDTGNILYTNTCQISPTDTSDTLTKKLAQIGATSLLFIINKITLGIYEVTPQNPLHATYAYKLNKKEARINWNLTAIELERRIRAFNPWPVSYFQICTKKIKVWEAQVATNHYYYQKTQNNQLFNILPGTILELNSLGIHVITGSGILILTSLQMPGKKKITIKDILNAYQKWFVPNSILK